MKFELEINLGKETLDVLRVLAVGVGVTPELLKEVRAEEPVIKETPKRKPSALELKRQKAIDEKNAVKAEPAKAEQEPTKAEPVKAEPAKAEQEPAKAERVKSEITYEGLRALATSKAKSGKKDEVREAMKGLGCDKLAEFEGKQDLWVQFETILNAL